MKLHSVFFALALSLGVSQHAGAADDHKGHDHGGSGAPHAGHDAKPQHGGVVSVVKDVNYELVVKADSVALYVADHGKPVDLKGASARLTLLSSTGKTEVALAPAGDHLDAKGSFKAGSGTKALATVTRAGQAPVTVRFTLK